MTANRTQTYAASKGEPEIDWPVQLSQSDLSYGNILQLSTDAGDYHVNPIGQLPVSIIRETRTGRPVQPVLRDLAEHFIRTVNLMAAVHPQSSLHGISSDRVVDLRYSASEHYRRAALDLAQAIAETGAHQIHSKWR